jgi:signal recognition particle receptor subunit beta
MFGILGDKNRLDHIGEIIMITPMLWFDDSQHTLIEKVFVIDSADRKRLEEGGLELKDLLAEKKLANIPLMVLANKQDLMTALKPQEV